MTNKRTVSPSARSLFCFKVRF